MNDVIRTSNERLLTSDEIKRLMEVYRIRGTLNSSLADLMQECAQRGFDKANTHETGECHIRPHDLCSAATCNVCVDADRFRWLQEAVDRNDRFSVYEYGNKIFELRTAIDIVRGMTAARAGA